MADCSTNPSQCHINAQCTTSSDGGYKCVCRSGFQGDGIKQCVEATVGCNSVNNCGSNAACEFNKTLNKYECVCSQVRSINKFYFRQGYSSN